MTLTTTQRTALENAIKSARRLAEKGAAEAIASLGVGEGKALPHLDPNQVSLRRRLRARSRAVGDLRAPNGSQETRHLTSLIAYEHWHRMLFARF